MAARDLFELKYGRSLVDADRRPGDVPVYGTNGRCGCHDQALFRGPGVIIGRKGQGPLGVEWTTHDYWVIDTAYALTLLRPDIDLRYAYFLIKFVGLNHLKDGTSNPTLSRDSFGAQAFPIPPLDQQCAISRILGSLDDKIELNRKMNETLEQMVRAIFKSWFTDFDPVRRNMMRKSGQSQPSSCPLPMGEGGRRPGEGSVKEIDRLSPDALVDSPLGKIPKGWRSGCVLDLGILSRDSVSPHMQPDTMFAHYSIPAYDEGMMPKIEPGRTILSNKSTVPQGAVLLSRLNPRFPRVWMPDIGGRQTAVCSTEFLVFVPAKAAYKEFVYCLFTSEEFLKEFSTRVTGTSSSHQRVQPESLRQITVVLPADEAFERFAERARPVFRQVSVCRMQSASLAAIRDALLPKLMSGEIRVEETGSSSN